ncbi:MAG TPA: SDR family NAD(P)-dependent oxidoreductase, partial [Steroidobacteraceae bacterium]|nr:SDR family NAD(P)-dependent oxidoreductase [Steroidobacteraceae bacterium]
MTEPIRRPKRKNPVVRTRLPVLPPWPRSRIALGLTAGAAEGRFVLQVCAECGAVQYPPREACHRCLSDRLPWREQDGGGQLISQTLLRHSHDIFFRERVPWRLGMVQLDSGPTVVVHLHGAVGEPPTRVRVGARLDKAGMGVLVGFPDKDVPHMADDKQLREMTCDPKYRKVFITDGKTRVGQALARALVGAGADLVWVGHAEPWKQFPGLAELQDLPQVSLVPLDVTDARSVKEAAGEFGVKVDILINNVELHRAHGIASRYGTDVARAEMEVNYLGLLRLAQEFGPVMRARGADGQSSAVAWVNLLSIFALSNFPPHGTYSASKAAALSLAQCLRAEMRPASLRVINIFPGPIEDEWNQLLPPPKLAPEAVARAVVTALKDGVEDVYPGDIAQEWLARWRESPKVLER